MGSNLAKRAQSGFLAVTGKLLCTSSSTLFMICRILAEGLAGDSISYVLDGIDASDLPAMYRHFISMLRKSLNGFRYHSIASSISW